MNARNPTSEFKVMFAAPRGVIELQLHSSSFSTGYMYSFVSTLSAEYSVSVFDSLGSIHSPGSPFKVNVLPALTSPDASQSGGTGIVNGIAGSNRTILIKALDSFGNEVGEISHPTEHRFSNDGRHLMQCTLNACLQHSDLAVLRALRQIYNLKPKIFKHLINAACICVLGKQDWVSLRVHHTG